MRGFPLGRFPLVRFPLMGAACLLIASCQHQTQPLTPLPTLTNNTGIASPRVNGAVGSDMGAAVAPTIETAQAPRISNGRTRGASEGGDVSLDFADTDIREIAKQVLGNIMKVNYTIDPAVHGTATIQTARPLANSQLLPTLEALLNENGATIVQSGDLYRVVPSASAVAVPSMGAASTAGSEVVQLRYASAKELVKVLQPYAGDGAKLAADPNGDAIIISGDPGARATVAELVRSFDVDMLAGQSYALFPVTNGDPGKVAEELQKVFQTENDGALSGIVRIVPMERVNAVLMISQQPRYIADAKRLFDLVEQGRLGTARSWHVYYVQNGDSGDVANVLQRAFTPNDVTAQPAQSAGSTAPGQQGSSSSIFGGQNGSSGGFGSSGVGGSSGGIGGGIGSSSGGLGSSSGGSSMLGNLGGNGSSSTGGTSGSLPRPPGGADEGSSPASESLSATNEGNQNANAMRIIADKTNNAILIYATPSEESTIESMLHKIDILPLQVRIDATIAEVTLNDNLTYGTQFTFKGGGIDGLLTNAAGGTISNLAGSTPGFNVARIGGAGNAQAVISALASITDVRVLSSPQVMVLDNQPAQLMVGAMVPYLSGTAQSTLTSTADVFNEVNYQQTGVILEVVPRVNSGGLVTLDVSQEVSDASSNSGDGSTSGIDSPIFNDRKVQSRIAVQDGQTIGIAGLISDTASRGNSGIPWLKDIPILGSLVSTQSNTRTRQELIVLITPHVMADQRQARALTEDLRQNLLNASLIPQELQSLPLQGSANPNAALTR